MAKSAMREIIPLKSIHRDGLGLETEKERSELLSFGLLEFWWGLRDSDPRPSRCKRDALTN